MSMSYRKVLPTINQADYTFLFDDPPPTELYTLSLHDALPIWMLRRARRNHGKQEYCRTADRGRRGMHRRVDADQDRKSTRLNSSHEWISYAVFCLKKKT